MGQVDKSLGKLAEKGKLTAGERSAALGAHPGHHRPWRTWPPPTSWSRRWSRTSQVKTQVFGELDRLTRPEAILASNTSSISITRLGAATRGRRRSSGCTS